MTVHNTQRVLMPCYVPEGIHDPCSAVRVGYYGLTADLRPDINSLRFALESDEQQRPALIVVIQYFGYMTDLTEVRALADLYSAQILDDRAHALFEQDVGHADFALFSLNKQLPVADGAILVSSVYGWDVASSPDPADLSQPPKDRLDRYWAHLAAVAAVRSSEEPAPGALCEAAEHYDRYYARVRHNYHLHAQSRASKLIVDQINLPALHEDWRDAARRIQSWILPRWRFRTLGGEAPFAIPIVLDTVEQRQAVDSMLFQRGILAARQVERWDHVPSHAGFQNEVSFMSHHLLLPVVTEAADLNVMHDALRDLWSIYEKSDT